jgi:hypothetical protein
METVMKCGIRTCTKPATDVVLIKGKDSSWNGHQLTVHTCEEHWSVVKAIAEKDTN